MTHPRFPVEPQPIDYSTPPPDHAQNRARRTAAMVAAVDRAWADAGLEPTGQHAALAAHELEQWSDRAWCALAAASGAADGYSPHQQTRAAVVSVFEHRAAAWQAQQQQQIPPKMIGAGK